MIHCKTFIALGFVGLLAGLVQQWRVSSSSSNGVKVTAWCGTRPVSIPVPPKFLPSSAGALPFNGTCVNYFWNTEAEAQDSITCREATYPEGAQKGFIARKVGNVWKCCIRSAITSPSVPPTRPLQTGPATSLPSSAGPLPFDGTCVSYFWYTEAEANDSITCREARWPANDQTRFIAKQFGAVWKCCKP